MIKPSLITLAAIPNPMMPHIVNLSASINVRSSVMVDLSTSRTFVDFPSMISSSLDGVVKKLWYAVYGDIFNSLPLLRGALSSQLSMASPLDRELMDKLNTIVKPFSVEEVLKVNPDFQQDLVEKLKQV